MFAIPPSGPDVAQVRDLHFQADRYRKLADDLDAIATGGFPDEAALRTAPLLEAVSLDVIFLPVLTGHVTGHPLLPGSKRRISTSVIEVICASGGWARTQSRFYRLDGLSGTQAGRVRTEGRLS